MARKIRIEYAGAAYHVMARGNQRRKIYEAERDRKLWLETLGEACEKTGWRLHSFGRQKGFQSVQVRLSLLHEYCAGASAS